MNSEREQNNNDNRVSDRNGASVLDNENSVKGALEVAGKKSNVNLEIKENFVHFTNGEGEPPGEGDCTDLVIPYNCIVFFAVNRKENYILFNYGDSDNEGGKQLKFYPEDKYKVDDIYAQIQHNNMLNPSEEFHEEPVGENELYTANSFKIMSVSKNYLASFVRKGLFLDFCLPELLSVCEMMNVPIKYDKTFSFDVKEDPMIHIDIPELETSGIGQKICDRAVLTKYMVKLYAEGKTYDELVSNVDREKFLVESDSQQTFKFEVDPRGKTLSQEEKLNIMDKFTVLNFKGKVDLKNPQRIFIVIDNHHRGVKYFGKLIAGKSEEEAKFYSKYNLQTRKYLGPTSTDNVLGFIMCNLAQIRRNDCVLDPFVGTGSLLIPPSHFNAVTMGCDIDMRVLKGYSIGYTKPTEKNGKAKKESNIFTNFAHYNLRLPQILRADINYPWIRQCDFFDAIVCDPPYGDRAFSRKTGMESNKKEKRQQRLKKKYGKLLFPEDNTNNNLASTNAEEINVNPDHDPDTITNTDSNLVYSKEKMFDSYHFAPLKMCLVNKIFENLLNLGSICVKKGGILVCLFPVKKEKGEEDLVHLPANFPRHPNFEIVYALENAYSLRKSRWCLVYKKL